MSSVKRTTSETAQEIIAQIAINTDIAPIVSTANVMRVKTEAEAEIEIEIEMEVEMGTAMEMEMETEVEMEIR